jgi:hypothetical protein
MRRANNSAPEEPMRIDSPNPDAEFQTVVGGLTEEQFALIEARLHTEAPEVRFTRERESTVFVDIHRFALKIPREDQHHYAVVVRLIMDIAQRPRRQLESGAGDLASLVRHRANAGTDRKTVDLLEGELGSALERLSTRLLRRAKLEGSLDLWFDGIGLLESLVISPLEISLRAYIYAGRASTSDEDRHPFEARLRSSPEGPYVDQCLIRIGDRPRLVQQLVMPAELKLEYTDDNQFTVRIGEAVPRITGQAIEWAIEIEKT